ncbi:Hypothetical predicted protein, partial [Cloeon dipterum]
SESGWRTPICTRKPNPARLLGILKLNNFVKKTTPAETQEEESIQNILTQLSPKQKEVVLQKLLKTRCDGKSKTMEEFDSLKQTVMDLMNTRT